MAPLCRLTVDSEDSVALARLAGEVDLSNAEELARELRARVSNRVLGLIVDLSEVEFIDSSGLGALFNLARRLESRQQQLRLVIPPHSSTRRVVELVELDHVAPLDASVEAAREAFAAGLRAS